MRISCQRPLHPQNLSNLTFVATTHDATKASSSAPVTSVRPSSEPSSTMTAPFSPCLSAAPRVLPEFFLCVKSHSGLLMYIPMLDFSHLWAFDCRTSEVQPWMVAPHETVCLAAFSCLFLCAADHRLALHFYSICLLLAYLSL